MMYWDVSVGLSGEETIKWPFLGEVFEKLGENILPLNFLGP